MPRSWLTATFVLAAAVAAAALALARGGAAVAAAPAPAPGPDLTVVGYGLAPEAAPANAYQLNAAFQAANPNAGRAIVDVEAAVRHAVQRFEAAGIAARKIQVGTMNFNYGSSSGPVASQTVMVQLTTLAQATRLVAVLSGGLVALNNYYLGSAGVSGAAEPAALARAYAQAWADARASAQALAEADGHRLGPPVAILEGSAAAGCPIPMGGYGPCPNVGYSGPPPGPNEALEAITVTFSTTRP
jgi:uncharacterized protein YggE